MVMRPGHFAVKCGCGMVGGCRKPDAPAGTPSSSGTHSCSLCDHVVRFTNPATSTSLMQPASAEEAKLLRDHAKKSIKCPVTAPASEIQARKTSYFAGVKVDVQTSSNASRSKNQPP